MTGAEMAVVLLAGGAAGAINAAVGSGTLITFPVLLAVGLPPLTANVTNTVGLVPGSVAGAWGYRRELAGQGRRTVRLAASTLAGALLGALLLLVLPPGVFAVVVPVLVALACLLVLAQPWLSARAARRAATSGRTRAAHGGPLLHAGVGATGVYGGYFGAAQGVLLIGLLGTLLDEDLHRVNAVKNVLAGLANLAAGLVFVAVADVSWAAAALVAVGSLGGGLLGARVARRLPAPLLRGVIVLVGVVAIVELLR